MEKNDYLTYIGTLYNKGGTDVILKSIDYPTLNNLTIPSGFALSINFKVPEALKIKEDRWFDAKGNKVILIYLVDKDF